MCKAGQTPLSREGSDRIFPFVTNFGYCSMSDRGLFTKPYRWPHSRPKRIFFAKSSFYIFHYMKTLIVELDDEVAAKLERVAPGRARQRSEFIRNAVRKALWEIEEQATAEA